MDDLAAAELSATQKVSALVFAQPSSAEQDSVVRIERSRPDGTVDRCSGTLIATNLVVTARHCLSERRPGAATCQVSHGGSSAAEIVSKFVSNYAAQDIAVYTGGQIDGRAPDARGARIITDTSEVLCKYDVALLVLDRNLTRVPLARVRTTPPQASESVTVVGWGMTEDRTFPRARLQKSDVKITAVGPTIYPDAMGTVATFAHEFHTQRSACGGDSGGPAFDANGALVGVVSRVFTRGSRVNDCMGTVVFSIPADHVKLLTAGISQALEEGGDLGETSVAELLAHPSDVDSVTSDDASATDSATEGCSLSPARPDGFAATVSGLLPLLLGLLLASVSRRRR